MRSPTRGDRSGFVLMLVVLMLFTISLAAATGYEMVRSEFVLSAQNREGQQALSVARAGLQRFLGEHVGYISDTVRYAIGDGIATVTARKLHERDADNHLYYIRSEGTLDDIRNPQGTVTNLRSQGVPARRTVGTYVWHRIAPVPQRAAILIRGSQLQLDLQGALVSGDDASTSADCLGGGLVDVASILSPTQMSADSDAATFSSSGWSTTQKTELYPTVGTLQDAVSDPRFPVDFVGSPPYWPSLPSDSFPVLRYDGNLEVDGSSRWSGGRGVLIVSGGLFMRGTFTWDGIILADYLGSTGTADTPQVRGMIVLNGSGQATHVDLRSGTFQYDFCRARAANESLSVVDAAGGVVFEVVH